ncbi:MAG: imidazole glycerol phosphate synthase subunit HisF [Sphingomonadales bacterium]|nr:MAG: imidazole glycerol phosphate synthase subunit HisF [Sphingomonadales bacterium]
MATISAADVKKLRDITSAGMMECKKALVETNGDIDAAVNGVEPDFKTIAEMASECRMPLCYGGGVTNAAQAKRIVGLGVEKVAISSAAVARPQLIAEMAAEVGRQSVAVVIDVKKRALRGGHEVWTHNAKRNAKLDPFEFAREAERQGAGEIVLNSIDNDGKMKGYDLALAEKLRETVNIPMTMLGGAGSLDDIQAVIAKVGTVGVAAGSLFVFKGALKAVLINYPQPDVKERLIAAAQGGQ